MTTIVPIITDAGIAAAVAAHGQGLDLKITHVVLGSGAYDPLPSRTALAARKEKATCAAGSTVSADQVVVIATFTSYAGAEYDLGEIGFYAGDPDNGGVLFAVASEAGARFSVRLPGGGSYTVVYTLTLSGVPEGSVTVVVDPNAGASSSLLAAHLAEKNPHPQYELPVGAEMAFMRKTAPRGWLTQCGALVSRTTYADLWAMAQAQGLVAASETEWRDSAWTMFGPGNGSTTFRLPDLRGEFVRGWDDNRGVDPGRLLGRPQGDAIRNIAGQFIGNRPQDESIVTGPFYSGADVVIPVDPDPYQLAGRMVNFDASRVVPTARENRPRNASRLLCIKAGPSTLPAGPEPITAVFSAAPTANPGEVKFTESSTGATSWHWDFGDGTTSTVRQPTKTFSTPGTYTVTLTVRSAADVVSRAVAFDLITVAGASGGSSGTGSGSGGGSSGGTGGGGRISFQLQ